MSFMWAIYLYSVYNERSPGIFYNSGKRAPSFLEVFLAAGTFSGIMGFCMKSAEISRLLEEKEATETRPKTQHLSEADSKQWIQEADSRTVMEAEASLPKGISTKRFVEADGSKPILEAGSRQIVEADSNQFYPRSKTSLEKKDSKDS
jgi:hypothetical protein